MAKIRTHITTGAIGCFILTCQAFTVAILTCLIDIYKHISRWTLASTSIVSQEGERRAASACSCAILAGQADRIADSACQVNRIC